MQGTNEMHLNAATMAEAVQMWLNAQFVKVAPTVTSVHLRENGSVQTFVVKLSSGDQK